MLEIAAQALPEAVGLADEFDDVGLVGQPIQEGQGQFFITKDLSPITKLEIGGHDQRDPLVQGGTELEDQMSAEIGEGDEAQLIQNDQLVAQGGGNELVEGMVLLSRDQLVDQGGGIVEPDPVFLPAGFQGQSDGDMSFSQAGITNQDDRFGSFDVLPSGQVKDPLLVERRNGTEGEIIEFFDQRELGGPDPLLLSPVVSLGHFLPGQG